MSGLIHTGLGLSSLIAHVLHSPPPPPPNSFIIGPAVINTHTQLQRKKQELEALRQRLAASEKRLQEACCASEREAQILVEHVAASVKQDRAALARAQQGALG